MIKVDIGMPSNCEECPFRPCKEYRKYIKESRGWLPLNFRLENCLITELVRCKDCRWFKQDSSPVGYGYCDGRMVGRFYEVEYNDFCSCGERREE